MLPISGILDRYLARQIVLGVVGTISVLTPLVWLMQVLHLLPLLSRQGVSFLSFLWMILLILPGLVEIILPVAVFIAILVTYSRAMTDRELTVMLASGRSPAQLSRPATFITGACILLSYLLTLVVVPYSARHIHHIQQSLRSQGAVLLLQDGVFFNIMPNLTVYVRQKDSNGELHGLLINDERQPGHSSTVLARHGIMVMKDHMPLLVMLDGSRQEIDPHTGHLGMVYFTQEVLSLSPESQHAEGPGPEELPLSTLLHPPDTVSAQERGRMIAEGWKRLGEPLTSLALAVIALNATLRGQFSRQASVQRPAWAVLAVISFIALNLMLHSLSVKHAVFGIVSPGIALLAGAIGLFRLRDRKS